MLGKLLPEPSCGFAFFVFGPPWPRTAPLPLLPAPRPPRPPPPTFAASASLGGDVPKGMLSTTEPTSSVASNVVPTLTKHPPARACASPANFMAEEEHVLEVLELHLLLLLPPLQVLPGLVASLTGLWTSSLRAIDIVLSPRPRTNEANFIATALEALQRRSPCCCGLANLRKAETSGAHCEAAMGSSGSSPPQPFGRFFTGCGRGSKPSSATKPHTEASAPRRRSRFDILDKLGRFGMALELCNN